MRSLRKKKPYIIGFSVEVFSKDHRKGRAYKESLGSNNYDISDAVVYFLIDKYNSRVIIVEERK